MKTGSGSIDVRLADWYGVIRRHLLLETIVTLTIFAASSTYVYLLPDVYRAETRIMVNPQRVSDKYVDSAVSMDSNERLNTLSQQVLSSSRLEAIMNELNLFPRLRRLNGREKALEIMRAHIGIELKQSSSGPSSFKLSYTGDSADQVAGVTNRLAQSFIDWNLRDRKQEVQGTTAFLSTELADGKAQLDQLEGQLRNYKLSHVGELPDQMQTNMQSLALLQVQLQANTEAQSRLDRETYLAMSDASRAGLVNPETAGYPSTDRLLNQRALVRQELVELQKRYTQDHPDVQAKQAELRVLDAQESNAGGSELKVDPTQGRGTNVNPHLQVIHKDRERLVQIQREIESSIRLYQSHVNVAPIREQEMQQLLRDYDTAKDHYRSLLEKTYSARMATELEMKQQGGGYTLLDLARRPDAPIGPNRPLLFGGSFLLALALGLAAAFGREAMDSTVKSELELSEILCGIPLLGLTPRMAAAGAASGNPSPPLQRLRRS